MPSPLHAPQVLRIGGFITDQESIDSPGMVHLSPNHLFLKFHILRFPHAAEYTSLALEAQVQTRSFNSIRLADGEFELSTPNQDGVEGMFRQVPSVCCVALIIVIVVFLF